MNKLPAVRVQRFVQAVAPRSLYEVEGSTENVESKTICIAARNCAEAERTALNHFWFTHVASVKQTEIVVWCCK